MTIPHIPFFHRFTSSITHELSIITNRLNALQGKFLYIENGTKEFNYFIKEYHI